MTSRRTVLGGAIAMVAAGAAFGRTGAARVEAPAGRWQGERLDDGVCRFLGIRYGTAPRFRLPQPLAPSRETIRAVAYGPAAPQRTKRVPQSEDCLTLNVWTPSLHPGARLPVMVYLHGGAFAFGSASDPDVDGQRLAARGVVVVSINHRLNALGYLYLAGLDPQFADSGNAGQHDLVLALRWVRDTIAGFGGDPGRVTLFGDSGGGGKVTALMAMPSAAGLFHRAATMSGQQVTLSGPIHATRRARAFLARAGVGEPAALLDVPVERLLDALLAEDPILGGPVYMGPVLDMRAATRHPFFPDAHPLSLGVPMLTGNARDETRAFYDPDDLFVTGMDWTNLPERIATELPVDLPPEGIITEYRRHRPTATPADLFFAITTDGRSWRGQLEVAEARARAGRPAWLYQMNFISGADPRRGAYHCIDVPLLFGNLNGVGTDADARSASRTIQDRFLRFARSGDPGWSPYTLPDRTTMIFDTGARLVRNPRDWQRELFARAPYTQPGS